MRLRFFRPRFRPWLFALTAASALALGSGVVAGEDSDLDEIPDDIEAATQRTVDTVTFPRPTPFALSVTSQSVGAEIDDKFRVRYESGAFEVEYFPNASSGRVASSYSLEVASLVEWFDANADGRVDAGEVGSVLPLGSDGFGGAPLEVTSWADPDGGDVVAFRIRSVGDEVVFRLMIAQRFKRISEDKVLTPMEANLEIWLNHTVARPGAHAGLEFSIETDDDMTFGEVPWTVTHRYSANESWMNITGGPPTESTVYFAWANRAMVDGSAGLALATPPSGSSGSYRVYLLYPLGTQSRSLVYHGASLGVVSEAFADLIQPIRPLGDAIVFAGSFAAVAVLVGASMILAKRRRRRA